MANSFQKLADILNIENARISGDPRRLQVASEMQEQKELKQATAQSEAEINKAINESNLPESQKRLLKALSLREKAALFLETQKPAEEKYAQGADGLLRYTTGPRTGQQVFPGIQATGKSAVSDPLRTITQGGKVIKNVRDSELTPEEITKINQAGQVIQPLGFTEKFESSKDVDFGTIKDKYLATQNLLVKTSELAQKFADEPSSALAVGEMSQFVDGVIQNIDVGGNLLSGAKDKKVYKYIQENSTSVEGKDFTDAIKKASIASGVGQSRIRDLAYLFAAARGQTGRGLSDKDFENALKIVSGGVGVAGRSAVLKDVSNSLREEFYRDINFDISTSENQAYVDRLKGLPELPYYVEATQQTSTPTTGGPRRIRRPVPQ